MLKSRFIKYRELLWLMPKAHKRPNELNTKRAKIRGEKEEIKKNLIERIKRDLLGCWEGKNLANGEGDRKALKNVKGFEQVEKQRKQQNFK